MIRGACTRLPFIIQKMRKEWKIMKKTMNNNQTERKNQEKSFQRMMAYQKKAEMTMNRKKMNYHMIRKG
jgi:Sec-independent protein translocase protein TatA